MSSLFDSRASSDTELQIMHEVERPGSWFGDNTQADGRQLTQEQTDILIRCELWARCPVTDLVPGGELYGILGDVRVVGFETRVDTRARPAKSTQRAMYARQQRGGIDSDPLVRLFAWRCWGDRDRNADPDRQLLARAIYKRTRNFEYTQTAVNQILRIGRWGTCVSCPTFSGEVYPEGCQFTDRYDHWIDSVVDGHFTLNHRAVTERSHVENLASGAAYG